MDGVFVFPRGVWMGSAIRTFMYCTLHNGTIPTSPNIAAMAVCSIPGYIHLARKSGLQICTFVTRTLPWVTGSVAVFYVGTFERRK